MRQFLAFGAACLTIIVLVAVATVRLTGGEATWPAIMTSGAFALVLQLLSFGVARHLAQRNVIAGWGLGIAIRFVGLAMYGLFWGRALGLRLDVALFSMAAFLFLTTLIEPLFLKP